MTFDAILFDWSGTLSDDRQPVYAANMKMFERWGIEPLPFDRFFSESGNGPVGFYHQKGVAASGDEIYEVFRQNFDAALTQGVRPRAYEDAAHTLSHIDNAGMLIAVVSAHPQMFLEQEAQEYGLTPFIDHLCGNARDKAVDLARTCKALGIQPNQSLYVGDTIYDIRAARTAGLHTAGITTGYHTRASLEAEEPDFLFENLRGLTQSL